MKALRNLSVFCLIVFLNLLFNNIVSAQNTVTPSQTDDKSTDVQEEVKVSSDNLPNYLEKQTLDAGKRNEKYRIGFQDTIEISVFRHSDLSQVVSVSPDGTILMPKIDRPIIAVCKTERELKVDIETLYKSYLKNPYVSVRVAQQLSQPFAVIGAVEKPGNFYLNRRIRLLELLAFAGGPKSGEAGTKIQVARVGNVTGCNEGVEGEENKTAFLGFTTSDVMSGKVNPYLQPGDIVTVLDAEVAYVVGDVNKPSKISLKEPVTLTQAIAAAEGLNSTAKIEKIIIQRQERGTQSKTEITYNLKDINSRKIPDPVLQANDIVEVPSDKLKTARKGLFEIFRSILPSAIYSF